MLLARKLGLFREAVVAIDGSKFKAVNNRDKNYTAAKMARRLAEIEVAIGRYIAAMDGADAAERAGEAGIEHLQEKLAAIQRIWEEGYGDWYASYAPHVESYKRLTFCDRARIAEEMLRLLETRRDEEQEGIANARG